MSTALQCQSTSGNNSITHTPGIVTVTDSVMARASAAIAAFDVQFAVVQPYLIDQ